MSVALSLQDVRVRFGNRLAVDGLTLTVNRGEVVGLLGPNGSGKSTTLAVAAGVLDPVEGSVTVEGIRHNDNAAAFAAKWSAQLPLATSCVFIDRNGGMRLS